MTCPEENVVAWQGTMIEFVQHNSKVSINDNQYYTVIINYPLVIDDDDRSGGQDGRKLGSSLD